MEFGQRCGVGSRAACWTSLRALIIVPCIANSIFFDRGALAAHFNCNATLAAIRLFMRLTTR